MTIPNINMTKIFLRMFSSIRHLSNSKSVQAPCWGDRATQPWQNLAAPLFREGVCQRQAEPPCKTCVQTETLLIETQPYVLSRSDLQHRHRKNDNDDIEHNIDCC